MKIMPAIIELKKQIGGCLILSIALLLIQSCGKLHESPAPSKATLTFPAQNSLCNSGTVISDTTATLVLTWNAAAHTDSYNVTIKNLLTGTLTTQASTTNQLSVNLLRNTPYSWYVVSKSTHNPGTAQSDTWKFYMSGHGQVSYSPFPAGLVSPTFGQVVTGATKVNLAWAGSDVDNDIVNYDVYFGSTATPPIIKNNLTDSFLNDVVITPGTTYYWRIATRDALGNISYSEIYQFKVD